MIEVRLYRDERGKIPFAEWHVMPLTVSFKETVMEDIRRHPDFGRALLREGVDALFSNELEVTKIVLRDYINATMGFDGLAKQVNIPAKSLMRMLGPSGNPQAGNLLAIIAALQHHAGVEFHVTSTPVREAKGSTSTRTRNRKMRGAKSGAGQYGESSCEAPRAVAEAGAKFKR